MIIASPDVMSLEQFSDELRRMGRYIVGEPLASPLDAALEKIQSGPAFAQSRLLGRMVQALTRKAGEFRRAEASVFDRDTLRLVINLLNVAKAGTSTQVEWERAATRVESETRDFA